MTQMAFNFDPVADLLDLGDPDFKPRSGAKLAMSKIQQAELLDELEALGMKVEGTKVRGKGGRLVSPMKAMEQAFGERGRKAASDYSGKIRADKTRKAREALMKATGRNPRNLRTLDFNYPGRRSLGKVLAKIWGKRAMTMAGSAFLGPLGILTLPLLIKDLFDLTQAPSSDPVADLQMAGMARATRDASQSALGSTRALETMADQAEAYKELGELTSAIGGEGGLSGELRDLLDGRMGSLAASSRVARNNNLDRMLSGIDG